MHHLKKISLRMHVASRHSNFKISKEKFLTALPNPGYTPLGGGVDKH